jgi:hypothetical protein
MTVSVHSDFLAAAEVIVGAVGVECQESGHREVLTKMHASVDNIVSVTQMIPVTQEKSGLTGGWDLCRCREKGASQYASE